MPSADSDDRADTVIRSSISTLGVCYMTASSSPVGMAALLDVYGVAELLRCSRRHVYRMSDAGRMPPPIRLGTLVRWDRDALTRWIADGCLPIRRAGRAIR